MEPDTRFPLIYLPGLALSELRRIAVIVCLSLAAISSQGGAPDQEAWATYESGNYPEAYSRFFRLFREHPQDESINFGLGLAAMKAGKLSHAKFAFERVLAMTPNNQRARLELGRTLAAMGLNDLAREEFETVLHYAPPERVKTNIEEFLSQIKSRSRLWTAEAQIAIGGFYDDNINIGPTASLIDTGVGRLQVAPYSLPESAAGGSLGATAAGTYDIGMREGWLLTAGLNGNQTWLPESPDHELRYLHAQAGLRQATPRTLLDLPIKVENLNYGHDSFVSIVGTEPMLLFAASHDWHHITQAGMEYRDYQDGDFRDGMAFRLNQTLKRFFGAARHSLALTAGGFHEAAELGGFSNEGPEVSLTGELRPRATTTLYGMAAYRDIRYRDILLTDLQSDPRRDHEFQYVAGIRQLLTKNWGLDLNYRHVDNQSNFDLYDYDRNIVNLTTFLCF
jgi:hypothetical protein